MQFYKISGTVLGIKEGDEMNPDRSENAYKIAVKVAEFNGADSTKCCFLSSYVLSGSAIQSATFGIIVTESVNLVKLAERCAEAIGMSVRMSPPEEITLSGMQSLLSMADRRGFIEDDNYILERFGLDRVSGRQGRSICFGENLLNISARREELVSNAKRYFMDNTLLPELDRIYAGGKRLGVAGHPVHYMIECDDRDVRREAYKIILDALHANQRLGNCRYAFIDFNPGESYSHITYESLYKMSFGGAVAVRYLVNDEQQEDAVSSNELDTIENLCEMAKKYRNKVLTIFCFPRNSKKIKAQFYERLGSMSFVEIREDLINSESARAYLGSLAKENHLRTDKKLFADISDEREYLAHELNTIFDEWYNVKLKSTIYPQYKELAVAHKEAVKSKPRGSAYDELMDMIGLREAKDVIKKALNYYKMQSLYEEKGVKRDNPAMHMIFTGNPGTAKTTVARLFARIMRENGLLSTGQLVEVGRGDLVGRYVGWTAQTVQSKFKAAKGGVLFIDEAYSLVDEHSGSFGDEAINTIVQEMENNREDVVVIFAGYPDKMEGFLNKNPGLRSRIAFHVPFADYDSEELCLIAKMMSEKNGMNIDKDAFDKLERVFDTARANADFGNGRYVRNVFEQAKMNQASRLLEKDYDEITAEEITTITADDIVIPEVKTVEKRQIGFF